MRKNDPRTSPDLSEMRSAISGNEKLELSFGKELMKDDDNISQLTFKSQTDARKSLMNSPSSPAKLYTSFMPQRSATVLKKQPLKTAANRKIKVFQRDASPSQERQNQPAVVSVLPKTIAQITTLEKMTPPSIDKDTFAGS